MNILLLYTSISTILAFAATGGQVVNPVKDDNSCAKIALAAVYSAEKSYYTEYKVYSDSDGRIGYSREPNACPSWEHSIRISANGQEFWAEAINEKTGELWSVDEHKKMVQEKKPN
jgi:hypothetical protein